ncbi:hypothetical protein N657DRAFT_688454 [Parathielavia appendiculata]|uniref:Uncharacterized protein n=1 Tax=Parathielavia appendiculata TaxID=2587402 RepID=A0AAN6Z697_9PEZI|nr:hypothetical protein N657DRAFT_688454 [Parathielavia appendiculata]
MTSRSCQKTKCSKRRIWARRLPHRARLGSRACVQRFGRGATGGICGYSGRRGGRGCGGLLGGGRRRGGEEGVCEAACDLKLIVSWLILEFQRGKECCGKDSGVVRGCVLLTFPE